ncbi:MAG: hypothetical protein WCC57_09160 [Paracoccaceae bacterium]
MKSVLGFLRARSGFLPLGRSTFRAAADPSAPEAQTSLAGNSPSAPQPDQDLDRYVDPINQFRWKGRHGLVLGHTLSGASNIVNWITKTDALIVHVPNVHTLMPWLSLYQGSYTFLLIDADNFNDADDISEFGTELRFLAPQLPLIIAPTADTAHSLLSDLAAACDVLLKHPVSRLALLVGIDTAIDLRQAMFPAA